MQQYKLQNVLVICDKRNELNIYAVLNSMHEVHDYIENELSSEETNVISWPAMIEVSSKRVWLFDRRFEPYQMESYSSEPTRKRKALQEQALAKLTPEEREALGYRSTGS